MDHGREGTKAQGDPSQGTPGERLVQAQKMEAVGRLAGGIAHDFNNILTSILGFTELLEAHLDDSDEARADLSNIRTVCGRASARVKQLLAFARKHPSNPALHDLRKLAERAQHLIEAVIGEHITLVLRTAPQACWARIDASHFEQILLNLAINARDAMPRGGSVSLAVDACRLEGAQAAPLPPGNFVRVRVSDNGVGIPPEIVGKIFEPFFSTKGLEGGSGLGLSTVYGMVEQSGGRISVESQVGKGTRFEILLPQADAGVDQAATEGIASRGAATILLVEDNELVRQSIARTLEQRGFHILVASDGEMALRLCEEPGVAVDLILSDVVMPVMTGPELVARLRERRPGLRALFMSGYTAEEVTQRSDWDGRAALIEKPFTPGELDARVRLALSAQPGANLTPARGVPGV